MHFLLSANLANSFHVSRASSERSVIHFLYLDSALSDGKKISVEEDSSHDYFMSHGYFPRDQSLCERDTLVPED